MRLVHRGLPKPLHQDHHMETLKKKQKSMGVYQAIGEVVTLKTPLEGDCKDADLTQGTREIPRTQGKLSLEKY